MTCPSGKDIMMWVDGEITGPKADRISEHLNHCHSCRAFVSAQKQMESVWRDAWVDPEDTGFETMRSRLVSVTPWWRMQRTWYIAAAVCTVYLGVRIFYVDGAGTPLASLVAEEPAATSHTVSEEISDTPGETPIEEMVDLGCEEQEEEIAPETDDLISGQTVISEVLEETLVVSRISTTGSESPDEGDVSLDIDPVFGFSEISTDMATTDREELSNDTETAEAELRDSEELYRSADYFSGGSTGSGAVEGVLSGGSGAGGGGGVGLSTVSGGAVSACDETERNDDLSGVFQRACPSQTSEASSVLLDYSVLVTLESKETVDVQREVWNALFSLIDSLQHEILFSSGETLVLGVSVEGSVSGEGIPAGTVIDLPEAGYGNCKAAVLFH